MKKISLCILLSTISFLTISSQKLNSQNHFPKNVDHKSHINISPNLTFDSLKFEAALLAEMNLLRSDPKGYIKYLEEMLINFDGLKYKNIDGLVMVSSEGKKPVEEAIEALKKLETLPQFAVKNGMLKAAQDHVKDLETHDKTGHVGSDKSLPWDRVEKYGSFSYGVFENIMYSIGSSRDVVLMMLVDDGNAKRSHRHTLLDPRLKVVGVAFGENKKAGKFCVVKFTESFQEDDEVD